MKYLFTTLISIFCLLLTVTACDDNEENINYTTLTVEIDAASTEFLDISTGVMTPAMWVREENKSDWKAWSQSSIEGYTYEEGYYTKAEIMKKIDNKRVGSDGGRSSYKLLKILEKKVSESAIIE